MIVRKIHGIELGQVSLEQVELEALEIQARRDRLPEGVAASGTTAVVPVHGIIVPRGELLQDTSAGTTSAEAIDAALRQAAAVPGVDRIVLDVDSPGGNVAGVTELAATVREIAAEIDVVAVANHVMASAAYWLSAGASEIIASPSAAVGSIGVYAIHEDVSKRLEKKGINPTLISAGKHKVDGNPFGPLSESARADAQARVDEVYGRFVAAVAAGRGQTEAAVRDGFGEGRAVGAKEALAAGMVDRVGTLREVVREAGAAAPSGLVAEVLGGAEPLISEVHEHRTQSVAELLARHELLKRRTIDTDTP
ncbi:MAG TPA: S49 family peptidase [Myxococcota bacterium]